MTSATQNAPRRYPESITINPVHSPVRGTANVPGSKSITNRALLIAALASGETTLTGALFSDDTTYMAGCLTDLGIDIVADETNKTYSKRIFDQEKALRTAEIENIINEIEQEGGE